MLKLLHYFDDFPGRLLATNDHDAISRFDIDEVSRVPQYCVNNIELAGPITKRTDFIDIPLYVNARATNVKDYNDTTGTNILPALTSWDTDHHFTTCTLNLTKLTLLLDKEIIVVYQ